MATAAAVLRHVETGRAKFGNLQRCGSVWTCPACAAQITEHRRREVAAVMDLHHQAGGAALMVTLTHSHQRADDLAELLRGERAAHAKLSSWRDFKAIAARLGRVGAIRAREMTWGAAHGWHPHTHDLWLVATLPAPDELERTRLELSALWRRACARAGLPLPDDEHGVSIDVAWAPAEYLAKWGADTKWGASRELTKAHSKRGAEGRWTPFDLLRDTPLPADQAARLWRGYTGATFGARQLTWSRGLRERLDLAEISDEAIVADGTETHERIALIDPADWHRVLAAEARARVLEAAEAAGATGVAAVLASLPEPLRPAPSTAPPPSFGEPPGSPARPEAQPTPSRFAPMVRPRTAAPCAGRRAQAPPTPFPVPIRSP